MPEIRCLKDDSEGLQLKIRHIKGILTPFYKVSEMTRIRDEGDVPNSCDLLRMQKCETIWYLEERIRDHEIRLAQRE